MKIIDQTPFYKENGSLSLVDRGRAIMQFGAGWIKEVEAQNSVITVLGRTLDKKYTLLHNVTPPALGTRIPIILVGPTGVYVLSVNHLTGLFSARGDQWGVITSGTLKPEKPNLLTRTERIAEAIQVYLQRLGYSDLNGVEPVLLCSDPGANVDSVRPIIRVVMRDALERFAISIVQGRVVLNPETVFSIVEKLLNPPAASQPKPVETAAEVPEPAAASIYTNSASPASILSESAPPASEPPSAFEAMPPPPAWLAQPAEPPFDSLENEAPFVSSPVESTDSALQIEPPARRSRGISRKQWAFLIAMAVVWCIILAVFAFLIARDFMPG
jgi:hypothetical protein